MGSLFIIYGSTGGNTEIVVDHAAQFFRAQGQLVTIKRAEQSEPEDLLKADGVILASPTYGHGTLQPDMAIFTEKLKGLRLKHKPCAVIGLGDPKYEPHYHVESANTLEKLIEALGGDLVLPALRISRSPVLFLDNLIPQWTKEFLETYNNVLKGTQKNQ